MGKRLKIAVAVLVVALVGVTAWRVTQPQDEPEPVYQGKKLSEWMKVYGAGDAIVAIQALTNANSAVRQAGTNAIPVFLRMLRAKDSPLKVKLVALAARQHIIKIQYKPARFWNSTGSYGFRMLGSSAQSAVPALIKIVDENISPVSQSCAIDALGVVGPAATEAVPSLLRWATNANVQVRSSAMKAVCRIDPEAAHKAGIKITFPSAPD